MKTTYKYRAYPSTKQKETLNRQMFLAKELYNLLLEKSKSYYKDAKKMPTEYRMNTWITQLKKERLEFAELHSQVLQNVSKRMSDAYKNFFRRCKEKKSGKNIKVGFPRYKTFVSSLTYPQTNGFRMEKKKVELSKIGRINFVNHRNMEGTIKTLTIKKTKSQKWYITVAVEQEDKLFASNNKDKVGIDLGITKYATISDGSVIKNTQISEKDRIRLKRLQKRVSKREKGSHKRRKAVLSLSRKYERIINTREDTLHKIANSLVHSYSFIAYEELNINGMLKNHHLARSISEESWGNFIQYLQYKAESAGCAVIGVNPKNTSRKCSECGYVQNMQLSEKTFHCEMCGLIIDRDLNASMNIRKLGLEKLQTTSGQGESNAFGEIVRPQREAGLVERGTILMDAH